MMVEPMTQNHVGRRTNLGNLRIAATCAVPADEVETELNVEELRTQAGKKLMKLTQCSLGSCAHVQVKAATRLKDGEGGLDDKKTQHFCCSGEASIAHCQRRDTNITRTGSSRNNEKQTEDVGAEGAQASLRFATSEAPSKMYTWKIPAGSTGDTYISPHGHGVGS